ncbi:MAG: hypothetical protein AAF431_19895, partial [Pseudomonadota bacterium]
LQHLLVGARQTAVDQAIVHPRLHPRQVGARLLIGSALKFADTMALSELPDDTRIALLASLTKERDGNGNHSTSHDYGYTTFDSMDPGAYAIFGSH